MLKSGDQIGQFTLLNQVGSGGFGDVWKAEKRTVLDVNYFALKFFRPKDDRIDYDKIAKELGVWKQLKGLPHIISVIELDRFDDYVYVVSDFADGGSLENWLKDHDGKASSQAEAVKITLEILRGLENLHEKGFVHRDLRPDNILIMNGRFCLADFGVSREIKTHSKATGTAGTLEYMPPEAFEKSPSITPQTDIWAVGVMLQKLLTGELPYPQEDYPALIAAITMFEPEEMPVNVPEDLREIVKKALQKQRENRFQTAREMIEALKNPQKFLPAKAKKVKDAGTIIDEDFDKPEYSANLDKTEELKVEPTKDSREIEAEKAKEQRRREEAELERKRREVEIERQKELEPQRQEAERKRLEVVAKEKKKRDEKKLAVIVFGIGALVLLGGLIWAVSSQLLSNGATNKATNTASTSSNNPNIEFVKIPSGSFTMGSPTSEKGRRDDEIQQRVTISKDFYLGKYEVTQAQWQAIMGSNPSNFKGDNLPVENVSWEDAQEFIKKLNAKGEGTYRLPTEAEWEYAARAGTTGDYYGNLDSIGWYDKNSGSKIHPVGEKQANAFGLYDMSGNVWEWCEDWYGSYPSGSVTDPTGAATGSFRVYRGGSWLGDAANLRLANRNSYKPSYRGSILGFRVVRN